MGFVNKSSFHKKVKKDILNNLKARSNEIESTGTNILRKSVEDLDVVDTRNLLRNTKVETIVGVSSMTIRLQTTNVEYAIYPYYGLGTNARYGPRDWIGLGARRIIRKYNIR